MNFILAIYASLAVTIGAIAQATTQDTYLSENDIATFYNQGYVVVKKAYDTQEVQKMASLTNEVIRRVSYEFLYSSSARNFSEINKEYRVYLDGSQVVFKKMEHGISILRVVGCGSMQPALSAILRSDKMVYTFFNLLGCNSLEQIISQFHPKEPNDGVEFFAHRDIRFRRQFDPDWADTSGQGSYAVAIIAVDRMTQENGGLWVDNSDYASIHWNPENVGHIPDERDQNRVYLEMQPGDMLFMHPHLLHGSSPNTSPNSRHTLLTGYCIYGANHKNYPGNCTNDILTKTNDGGFTTESADWKVDDDPPFGFVRAKL